MLKVTWSDVERFIAEVDKATYGVSFSGVFGPPRGGLPLAVMLSHRLKLPLLQAPARACLIVDDIADTGQTLAKHAGKLYIATMFYHRQCCYVPNYWMLEKKDQRVFFPWEV